MADIPRQQLLELAQEVLEEYQHADCNVAIHFKYTCENCQTRVMLQEPNLLRDKGECCICGHTTEIKTGGFAIIMKFDKG